MSDTTTPFELNQRWADAFNARDVPTMMAMYEDDAVLVPGPGAEPLRGHAAIEASLKEFLALGGTLRFTPRHWLVQGDLVLGSIAFVMDGARDPEGDPVELAGVTAEVLRRQADGTLKYVIDHAFGGGAA